MRAPAVVRLTAPRSRTALAIAAAGELLGCTAGRAVLFLLLGSHLPIFARCHTTPPNQVPHFCYVSCGGGLRVGPLDKIADVSAYAPYRGEISVL